jgi:hypothetical protein
MLVKQAREVAHNWVKEEANRIPGFYGAFYHGSINSLVDDAYLPATSDIDIMVVLADADIPNKPGKFRYQEVLLEVSYLPFEQIQSPERILSQYHFAPSFKGANIIADPSGQLMPLQETVSKNFSKREWVNKRCEQARDKVLRNVQSLREDEPLHVQVIKWLFAAGVTTHVLLVAGLKNPTVRKRYLAVRDLLQDYGYLDFYENLLHQLNCAYISRECVEHHLLAMTEVFDATARIARTPFPFVSDIRDVARPIAIDGSRDLIERGYHREAIFWIAVTYSRCMTILHHDAPIELQEKYAPAYRQLLGDIDIQSFADIKRHTQQLKTFLPRVWNMAEAIIDANQEITG